MSNMIRTLGNFPPSFWKQEDINLHFGGDACEMSISLEQGIHSFVRLILS